MYTLDNVDRLISIMLSKLTTNQNLMKCLYYPNSDALYRGNLTQTQIDSMFDNKDHPESIRMSFTPFTTNLSSEVAEKSEIRIFIRQFTPDNIHLTNMSICVQVIVHNNLWKMDDARIRTYVILSEILKALNGVDIGFVGLLYFNSPIRIYNYNTYFSGYELYPEVRSV